MTAAAERVVFSSAVEGLFLKGLGPRLGAGARQRLKTAGLDLNAPLLPGYAYADWQRFVALAAAEVFPELPPEEAYHQLGALLVDGYYETLVGRALKGMVKLIGTRRTLQRMRQNFRGGNNYSEVTLEDRGPTHVVLTMNDGGLLAYFTRGILARGLEVTGPKTLSVKLSAHDDVSASYDIEWS